MDCLHVFVSFSLMAINQHGFGRVKVQTVLSFLFTISATLTFSCNHRKTVDLSLSPCVSLCFSNWCAASTHQLSGEGPIAELWASQLLSRQAYATRTQSDIQNLPEGSATAARWRRGQSGSNAWPAPPVLRRAFILMELTNTNSSKPQGLEGGREGRCEVRGPREEMQRGLRGTNNTEQRECIVWAGSNVAD